jgi:ribosome-associated protein
LTRPPRFPVPEEEVQWRFVRASGPGGQNVNKVSTAVELRFDLSGSRSIPEEVKDRLRRLAGRRLNADGMLVIDAQRFRSQARNREDALNRLSALIEQAARPRKARLKTKPTAASRERRLEGKRHRSKVKRSRTRTRDEA